MSYRNSLVLFGTICLGLVAFVCAAVAWSRISQLSLPLPVALPALNVILPVVTALVFPLSRRLFHQAKERAIRLILPYLAYAYTLLPFAVLILSLLYANPGDIQTCGLERHWLRMFEDKNARAIRRIQTTLQCCGLNSIHDRAWPFPSRDVDARACERIQGYTVPCGDRWQHEEAFAATLTAVGSLLNWLALIVIVANFPQDQGQIRLPTWSSNTRLIEEEADSTQRQTNSVENEQQSEQARIWERSHNN